jgi:methionyl-tRNA formyltransferase
VTRVAFFGSASFSVPALDSLAAAGHQVVGVYTQPDRPAGRGRREAPGPVKQAALRHGLPVYQPRSLRRAAAVAEFRALAPDVVVLAAYGLIFPQTFLDVPPHGSLNVHPSLLPRWRGPSPIVSAVLAGDTETGSTIFLMDAGMDTGPVLAQRTLAIGPEEPAGALTARLAQHGAELLQDTLPAWLRGELTPQPQDEPRATVSRMLTKADGLLDWTRPAEELARRIRAFDPWPSTYTTWEGQTLKVLEARARPEGGGEPGQVVRLGTGEVAVAAGEGALALVRVQLEGRKPMPIGEFVRGQPRFVGGRVG